MVGEDQDGSFTERQEGRRFDLTMNIYIYTYIYLQEMKVTEPWIRFEPLSLVKDRYRINYIVDYRIL